MANDPASLDNLRDLALPPQVPYWPPAPGVLVLAAGVLAAIAILAWRAWRRYRADAYRRAGLAELDTIAASIGTGGEAVAERVSAVLKRVALVTFERDEVAPLTGAAWIDFMDRTAGPGFERDIVAAVLPQAYQGDAGKPDDLRKFVGQARIWVKSHSRPADMGGR